MPSTPAYSLEFRREAVRLLRTSGRSVPQLAKELGCSPQSLRNWARRLDVDIALPHPSAVRSHRAGE